MGRNDESPRRAGILQGRGAGDENPCSEYSTPTSAVEAEPQEFLAQFPANRRSTIANDVLNVIRAGHLNPDSIAAQVLKEWHRKLGSRWIDEERREHLRALILHAREERDAFHRLIHHYIEYERLPASERARIKEERAKAGRQQWMSQQPPTEAQLSYLRHLGHTGPVASKLEASRLIDECIQQREQGGVR